jgi:hypothetical protein
MPKRTAKAGFPFLHQVIIVFRGGAFGRKRLRWHKVIRVESCNWILVAYKKTKTRKDKCIHVCPLCFAMWCLAPLWDSPARRHHQMQPQDLVPPKLWAKVNLFLKITYPVCGGVLSATQNRLIQKISSQSLANWSGFKWIHYKGSSVNQEAYSTN